MRIGQTRARQTVGKGRQGHPAGVGIEAGQDKDVGIQPAQHPDRRRHLRIAPARNVAQQQARPVAFQPDVPCRDAQSLVCGTGRA